MKKLRAHDGHEDFPHTGHHPECDYCMKLQKQLTAVKYNSMFDGRQKTQVITR